MASPLEQLRQAMANPMGTLAPENRPGALLGEQEQIQRLAGAQTGKAAAPGTAPRLSTIQEQVAAREAGLGAQQLAQQGQLEALRVKQEEDQIQDELGLRLRELDDQRLAQQEYQQQQTQTLLDQFTTGQRQLNLSRDKATMEQVGFQLRLNNSKYIKQLQDYGRRARLDNKIKFQEELQRTIFAEEESMFQSDLLFRSMINAKGREFTSQLAQIDLDFALQIATMENEAASQRMMWQGAASAVSGGLDAYAASQPSTVPTTLEGGTTVMEPGVTA